MHLKPSGGFDIQDAQRVSQISVHPFVFSGDICLDHEVAARNLES